MGSVSVIRKGQIYEVRYAEKKSKNKQPGLAKINHETKRVLHQDPVRCPGTFTDYWLAFLAHCHPDIISDGSPKQLFQHPLKLANPSIATTWLDIVNSVVNSKKGKEGFCIVVYIENQVDNNLLSANILWENES